MIPCGQNTIDSMQLEPKKNKELSLIFCYTQYFLANTQKFLVRYVANIFLMQRLIKNEQCLKDAHRFNKGSGVTMEHKSFNGS